MKKSILPVETLLTLSSACLVLFLIYKNIGFIYTGLLFGIVGLIPGKLREWVHFVWHKFSALLGLVFPKILLSIVFFFILFPLSLIRSVFTKNTNPLNLKNPQISTFKSIHKPYQSADFEHPW